MPDSDVVASHKADSSLQSAAPTAGVRYNRATYPYASPTKQPEDQRHFQQELADPLLCQDPDTESIYKIYSFNQDRFDPNQPVIGLLHAFGSSPTTRQGHEICWELRQRFPNNLIVAIGSEGTGDVNVSRQWLNIADHTTLARIRKHCLSRIRSHYDIPKTTPLNLVGQSFGGILAFEIAKTLQADPDIPTHRIALLATPSNPMRTSRFVTDLTRQELRVIIRRTTRNELFGMSKNAAEILPRNIHTGSIQKKLLSLIASARVDVRQLAPETDITICAGEFDAISRFDLASTDSHHQNIRQIIVEGDVHSDFLSDTAFCGHLIEAAWS